jgi:hypothetical protein
LINKLCELSHAIAVYQSDIACITETHLNAEITDAEISLPGFKLFRQDRNFAIANKIDENVVSCGGGCIIYVKEDLNPTVIDWFNAPDSIAIEIDSNIGRVNVACVYRSVSLSIQQNTIMTNMIRRLADSNNESIVVGDFNLPNVSWVSGTVNAPLNTSNKALKVQKQFIECIQDSGFVWYITDEVTRRRVVDGKLQESTLDQVLSTNEAIVNDIEFVSPLGKSDHVCLNIELNLRIRNLQDTKASEKKPRLLWGKVTSEELFHRSTEIDWSFSKDVLTSEDMWKELHSKLILVEDIVPAETNPNKMPWVNSALKRCRKEADKLLVYF